VLQDIIDDPIADTARLARAGSRPSNARIK
jgi:hypothetical protein